MALSPQNKKYLTYTACGVGVIVLLKLVLPKTDSSGRANDPTNNGMPGGGTVPSNFNPSVVAEKLYDAMRTTGTDEAAIFNALQPVNQAMFSQVYGKFGKRSYNKTMGNQINYFPITPLPLEDLKTWLRNELSDENYNTLRLKYPLYL
ncbi:hypothetical protein [Flavobacterium sp.]|uniref:hypothetical protein n=1 Tax=Flavobacterium sp. TaxID=239 RepID=UPI004033EA8C